MMFPASRSRSTRALKSLMNSESRGSRFELRADAFNVWNHTQSHGDVNTGGISLLAGSGNFGELTSAFDPREFQLGAAVLGASLRREPGISTSRSCSGIGLVEVASGLLGPIVYTVDL